MFEKIAEKMIKNTNVLNEKVKEIYNFQMDRDNIYKKLAELEERSSWNKLQVDGMTEDRVEMLEMYKGKVKKETKPSAVLKSFLIHSR